MPGSGGRALRQVWRPFGLLALAALLASPAQAATMYLLTENNELQIGRTEDPTKLAAPVAIEGLVAGDQSSALDVRPQNQALYALAVNPFGSNTATLYLVEPRTAVATPVGPAFQLTTDGATLVPFDFSFRINVEMDFDPASDRLRVVAGGLSFRIDPNTGQPIDGDNTGLTQGAVAGVNPDGAIKGAATAVESVAYTNNQPNDGISMLYTLGGFGPLFIQGLGANPNTGTQTEVGQLTFFDAASNTGGSLSYQNSRFDILPGVNAPGNNTAVTAGAGFMVARLGGVTNLWSVNLTDAFATKIGTVGDGSGFYHGVALRTELSPMIGLAANGASLVRFDLDSPAAATSRALILTAVAAGETLVGIDYRPATGQLYGLGINPGANTGTLYLIDPQSGVVSVAVVGTAGAIRFAGVDFPDPGSASYGIDFNPAVGLLRVVTSTGLNFRLDPTTGLASTATPDGALNGATNSASATAYTNSHGQTIPGGVTTQYTLDAATDSLYIQAPPNSGTQANALAVTLGGNPLDISGRVGFDIPSAVAVTTSNAAAQGNGYFVTTVAGVTGLYRLNLATGEATSLGPIGNGTTPLTGLVAVVVPPILAVENPINVPVFSGASTLAIGSAALGTSESRSITLKNTGKQPIFYSTSFATGTSFSGGTGTVPPGGSASLTVTFQPAVTGALTDTLTITTNDPFQPTFAVLLTGTGLVPQEIEVEAPVGTAVQDGAGTLAFGSSLIGTPVTRQVKITNAGEVPLTYSTGFATGTKYSVTANGSGSIAPAGSTTLTVTYTPTAGTPDTDTLQITSNDTSEPIFDVALTGQGLAPQADDVIIGGNGATRFQPLANDPLTGTVTITAVSDAAIQISGRTLIIPSGYSGTFTYTTSNGTITGQATVTVGTTTPAVAPTRFNGIVTDLASKVAGWATTTLSAKGTGSTRVSYKNALGAVVSASATLKFPVGVNALGVTTKAGAFAVDRSVSGAVSVTFTPAGGTALTGVQHAHALATASLYTIELASLDSAIPGGGWSTATFAKSGAVTLRGVLPDGTAFSAGSNLTDVQRVAFFTALKTGVKPPGALGGELTFNTTTTADLTGELVWNKPPQTTGVRGLHLGGVDTTLTARGEFYDKLLLLPVGNADLELSGGNLAAAESNAVAVTGGIPAVPTGSLVTWSGPTKKGTSATGLFSVTVTVPGVTKPVKGSGVYLQKSKRAWGYFPGTTLGGRIELTFP